MSKVRIGDVGKVVTGRTPETEHKEYYGGNILFITPSELHGERVIHRSQKTITNAGLASLGDSVIDGTSVLVGCIGWDMGNVAMCFDHCATNQQINSITKIKDFCNPFYLYYWLSTKKEYLFSLASVTRTPILNKSTFENITIQLPNRTVQDKVVAVLTSLDDKIQHNNAICSELEAMAKTLYEYWFVQFDFPDENGKPYKTSGGAMEWNVELKRKIPKGWGIKRVSQLMRNDTINVNPKNQSGDILEHYSIPAFDNARFPTFEYGSAIDSGKYMVPDNAILVSKLNPHFKRVWDPLHLTKTAICSTEFMVFVPNEEKERSFCYAVLNSEQYHNYLVKNAISSTGSRKRVQPKTAAEYCFAYPDDMTREAFSEIYKPILVKQRRIHIENHELTKLRDELLPVLMNGQAMII